VITKIQFKKRKNREESAVREYKRSKRKATREIESFDDTQKIETAIENYSNSIYKVHREFKKEIFSLKRRVEKAERVIEKVRINEKVVFENHNIFSAGVSMM
jgi:hypothetical protein